MDDKTVEALGLAMNAVTQALAGLNKCLLNNQSLKPGQFSGAIKQTFKGGGRLVSPRLPVSNELGEGAGRD